MSASSLRELVTSKKQLVATSNELTSLEIMERALTIAGPLASTQAPNDMTAWYCKAYRSLGEGKYLACAKAANSGRSPKKLFGYLLKTEMERMRSA